MSSPVTVPPSETCPETIYIETAQMQRLDDLLRLFSPSYRRAYRATLICELEHRLGRHPGERVVRQPVQHP